MAEKVSKEPLLLDPVFRHIAGEGWHPGGLNRTVLGALAFEQKLLEELQDKGKEPSVPANIEHLVQSQKRHVEELIEKHGLSDRPPLPPEE